MLSVPSRGFARSALDLTALCDWIESSVLFDQETLSVPLLVDVLREEQLCEDQESAYVIVNDAWAECARRRSWIDSAWPFDLTQDTINLAREWQEAADYTFCLLLSLTIRYRHWAKTCITDYGEQGELFELMTMESLIKQFSDWRFLQTGWSRSRTQSLRDVVQAVASFLGEQEVANIYRWTKTTAKDAGLDIVCQRPFRDGRVSVPVYLIQCASGSDFEQKLKMPDLATWKKIVDFVVEPRKGFATPYAFADDDFVRYASRVEGMLLERYRILAAGCNSPNWLSDALHNRLVAWSQTRISLLPRRAD
jgi:hypothetical protein